MSRRTKRYENRIRKREEKREQKLGEVDSFENVAGYKQLYSAANESANGVRWKASVQKYLFNICMNAAKTRKALKKGKDVRQGFIEFDICERGKMRHIRSVHFGERVVQKSLCKNVLYPILTYNLIYDNGASQKGKGTYFASQRLVKHLRQHFRKTARRVTSYSLILKVILTIFYIRS